MPYREFLNGYYKFRKEVYPNLRRVYQDLAIEGQNPSVDALVDFLTQQEAIAIAKTRDTVQGGGVMDGYGGETDPSTGI